MELPYTCRYISTKKQSGEVKFRRSAFSKICSMVTMDSFRASRKTVESPTVSGCTMLEVGLLRLNMIFQVRTKSLQALAGFLRSE